MVTAARRLPAESLEWPLSEVTGVARVDVLSAAENIECVSEVSAVSDQVSSAESIELVEAQSAGRLGWVT